MDLDAAYDLCVSLVKERDKDRFLATLFAPEPFRKHVLALHAFDLELSSIRALVSEPIAGEIRLQWWRDALQNVAHGDIDGHPTLAALRDTAFRFGFDMRPFVQMADARTFDLYDDPFSDAPVFEAYAGETTALLYQVIATVLGEGEPPPSGDAAGHVAVAATVGAILKGLCHPQNRGRALIPVSILTDAGASVEDLRAAEMTPELSRAITLFAAYGFEHWSIFDAALPGLLPTQRAAFLPLAALPTLFARAKETRDPFTAPVDPPQWRRQWMMWRRAGQIRR